MDSQFFYYIVGGLILTNISAIITIFGYGGKLIWWMSKMEVRVEKHEAEIKILKGEYNGAN